MRGVSLVLACLACAAQGRRIHKTDERTQESNPLDKLAQTLLAFNAPAAPGGHRVRAQAGSQRAPVPTMQEEVKMSRAMPFLKAPPYLDGSMPGDQGFDPMGISTNVIEIGGNLRYFREVELMHGRQAMLACVGFVWPSVFGKLNVEWAESVSFNPLYAMYQLPNEVVAQLFIFMLAAELQRANIIFNEDREPGDHGFDPLDFQGKFCKTPEELFIMKEKELANGRLAMIAFAGFVFALAFTGEVPPFL
mmetsp:Transcript_130384/g.225780  ORF Transcript_130384/g.225780 Transcript_130384/m.225780 type:complete len:249 (-) Transcript_130384:205-951(-)